MTSGVDKKKGGKKDDILLKKKKQKHRKKRVHHRVTIGTALHLQLQLKSEKQPKQRLCCLEGGGGGVGKGLLMLFRKKMFSLSLTEPRFFPSVYFLVLHL